MGSAIGAVTHEDQYGSFMQGVHDDHYIVDFSPIQMGVLLSFVPLAKGYYVLDNFVLSRFRRAFSIAIKNLIQQY